MAADTPLSILFLWHQHQPLYKDGLQNRYEMPWVRLHATKDYYDMVALLDEFPSIQANFNLVPSLLTQLDDYAQKKAQDKFIDLTLKSPATFTYEDRQFILQNFFMAHWEHMIDPYPRYRELLDKRGRTTTAESLSRIHTYFKDQDWRDLQVWFNLAWFDPYWKEKDPFINGLYAKGKNFSEEDKQKLVDKQLEICALVVGKHKEMQEKGQIEITTTPFYHPIMPLLCDTEAARVAMPHAQLPKQRFVHPEDAKTHLQRAVEDYTRRFGQPPRGMWPSEGSVSEEVVQHMLDAGIQWAATDEDNLARSFPAHSFRKEQLYQPYRVENNGRSLNFFFRDHELSDAIGFVYASWDPETAADDFIRRLHRIRTEINDPGREHVVSVILDGENCWEYYQQDGLPFLRALYKKLSNEPLLKTVRGSEFLARQKDIRKLDRLWSGSWINSNFAIWIGHAEDNLAWDLLFRTRQHLVDVLQSNADLKTSPQAAQAWEEIYIAEGSDWCWWYGDDHTSANDATFDYLFRRHLMNVYVLLGEKVPDDLHLPIKKKRLAAQIVEPTDFIRPTLDGKITSYFEWRSAGHYHTEASGTGTMQKAENMISSIYFGFDMEKIYVRIDLVKRAEGLKNTVFRLGMDGGQTQEIDVIPTENGELYAFEKQLLVGKYDKIIELALPLNELKNDTKQPFKLSIRVLKDQREQERWPAESTFFIPYPSENLFALNWQV